MLEPKRAPELLGRWFREKGARTVTFAEVKDPPLGAGEYAVDSYGVVYEAHFEPSTLDQARVEIWITENGRVAVGFESIGRVSQRLGLRARDQRFAGGHEPVTMSEAGLLALLDLISNGDLGVAALVLPVLGLVRTRAVRLRGDITALRQVGYLTTTWIAQSPPALHRVLSYQRWL